MHIIILQCASVRSFLQMRAGLGFLSYCLELSFGEAFVILFLWRPLLLWCICVVVANIVFWGIVLGDTDDRIVPLLPSFLLSSEWNSAIITFIFISSSLDKEKMILWLSRIFLTPLMVVGEAAEPMYWAWHMRSTWDPCQRQHCRQSTFSMDNPLRLTKIPIIDISWYLVSIQKNMEEAV